MAAMTDIIIGQGALGMTGGLAGYVALFVVYLLLGLLPSAGAVYLIYFLVTLPMRRNERARQFVDLLQRGLKDGRSPEASIVSAAATRDPSLGVRFQLLAAHIESGLRLGDALNRVPQLLPPQLSAVLKVGERIGAIDKVLPAASCMLRDPASQVRGAMNYLVLLVFAITPVTVFVPIVIAVRVLPSFNAVFLNMAAGQIPAFSRAVFSHGGIFVLVEVLMLLVLWTAAVAYFGGPKLRRRLGVVFPWLSDFMFRRLPWRRKRLQRDFSAILTTLLDNGASESESVALAAECTASQALEKRARRTLALLKNGTALPEAISAMDDTGELKWRLANAVHGKRGFLRALAGWHGALDAQAFQLEQGYAQLATTCMVLLNGFMVGCITIAIFLVLSSLMNEAVLW
jgi:type II secretory pathway component PulF